MTRQLAVVIVVATAVIIGSRFFPYTDGSFDNGELVGGVTVGVIRETCVPGGRGDSDPAPCGYLAPARVQCLAAVTERCVTPIDRMVESVFPGGVPAPITRVTWHHDPQPLFPWQDPPLNLAGHTLAVLWLADGTRHAYEDYGIGELYETRDVPPS